MKILFLGWNENGEKVLASLIRNGYIPKKVFVPEGYDVKNIYSICKSHKIAVSKANKDIDKLGNKISLIKPDLIIIASFPWLISQNTIGLSKLGIINVHAGELPKYRGYHPINWAIIRDEPRIGVTVHYVDAGMDSGNILAQKTIPIKNNDTVITLRRKLTTIGARLLVNVVKKIDQKSKITGKQQRDSQVIFAPRRYPKDSEIKWSNNTRDIFNLIRALRDPYPNAFSYKSGKKIEFKKVYLSKTPGKVIGKLKGHYVISTGDGAILIKTLVPLKVNDILG